MPGIESDEIATLYALRALCEAWRQTAIGRPLDRLWMKLTATGEGQGALMPMASEPWLAVRSPFGIDYRAHDKTIATLDRATRDHLAVNCRYRAISTGDTTARVIEPGELYWDPGLESLYVIGWCRLRQDVRVFAAHRFLAAVLTDDRFTPHPEARSKKALHGAFRVWRDRNITKVRVLFAAEVAPEIRERVWAIGQHLEEIPENGSVVLTVEVAGLPEIERWILGYGDRAEVLAPAELRQSVAARVTAAAARYAEAADGAELPRRSPRRMPPATPHAPKTRLTQDDNAKG